MESNKKCSICLDTLVCPVRIFCNHCFCVYCINKIFVGCAPNKKCPLCRITVSSPILNDNIDNLLLNYSDYIWAYKSNNNDTYWLYDPATNKFIIDCLCNKIHKFDINLFPNYSISIKFTKLFTDIYSTLECVRYLFDEYQHQMCNIFDFNIEELVGRQTNSTTNTRRSIKCFKKSFIYNSIVNNENIFLGIACAKFKL